MLFALMALFACTEPAEITGTLLDALTGKPIVGEIVRAETYTEAGSESVDSARISAPTDARGRFHIEQLAIDKQYSLVPQSTEWMLAEPVEATASVELAVWRVPPSDGVYRVGAQLTQLVTNSAIGQLYLDNGEAIAHPLAIPGHIPAIAANEALLFVGDVTDGWNLTRLFPAPEAPIRVGRKPLALAGWWLVGAQLEVGPKGALTVQRSVLDLTFTTTKLGSRAFRYLSGTATVAGRYMIHHPDVSRVIVVDFAGIPAT